MKPLRAAKRKRKRQKEVSYVLMMITSVARLYILLQEFSEVELDELAKEARLLKKFKAGKVL